MIDEDRIVLIKRRVADFYGVPEASLKSLRRSHRYLIPRYVAMVLARDLTRASLPKIAAHFNRDHTSVHHALKAVENRASRDAKLAAEIDTFRMSLQAEFTNNHSPLQRAIEDVVEDLRDRLMVMAATDAPGLLKALVGLSK